MEQFKAIEFYSKSKPHNYRLLPFRFSPLNDDEYLLTNQVGEYLITTRQNIERFARHSLLPSETFYKNLKSKHFLLDDDSDLPLELLGLKARTKLHVLANFTALHMFVVSLRCEHSCPYCQVSRQSDDKLAYDMSRETADRALDLVFRSPSPSIKIEFQGGEPLLNFDLIKYIVEKAEHINDIHSRDLGFVIATNLALINDDVLNYCRLHNILISTSLDGPRDLHNANRPRPGGNSYELTVKGIEKARDFLGRDRVSALMTTTQASLLRVTEIIDEYVRLGFDGIFLRQLSPYGFAVKTKWYSSYSADEWLQFYKEGLKYIIQLNKQGVFFVEQFAATILTKILTPFDAHYVDLMSPAGAGIAAVVYNYDGSVYASDESRMLAEMGDPHFQLGNVHRHTYEELFLSDNLLDALESSFAYSAPMCNDCAYEPYCGSDPVYHYRTQGDVVGHKPTSNFCRRNMEIIKMLIEMMSSDKETKRIFHSWVSV